MPVFNFSPNRYPGSKHYQKELRMTKPGLLSHAANFAPGFLGLRRRTWIGVGLGLLVLIGLLIWAALAVIGWLWGQTQSLAGTAPDALQGTARSVVEQIKGMVPGAQEMLDQAKERVPGVQSTLDQAKERVPGVQSTLDQVKDSIPGARDKLAELVPALTPETLPQRDVSGEDLGPVGRPAGLVRSQWQRAGTQAVVAYEGKTDYVTVLDHYTKGFAAHGFKQNVESATPSAETHKFSNGAEQYVVNIAQKTRSHGDSVAHQVRLVLQRFLGARIDHYLAAVGSMTKAVVWGLVATALAQGFAAGLGYWWADLKAPVLLGAVTALVAMIPFGAPFVWGSIGVWLLVSGDVVGGIGLLLWGTLVVSWVDNLVRPLVISSATRIPFLLGAVKEQFVQIIRGGCSNSTRRETHCGQS